MTGSLADAYVNILDGAKEEAEKIKKKLMAKRKIREDFEFLGMCREEGAAEPWRCRIVYNLSTMTERPDMWVELINHEWLHYLLWEACGDPGEEWLIDYCLEWTGLLTTAWGGCIDPKKLRKSGSKT